MIPRGALAGAPLAQTGALIVIITRRTIAFQQIGRITWEYWRLMASLPQPEPLHTVIARNSANRQSGRPPMHVVWMFCLRD